MGDQSPSNLDRRQVLATMATVASATSVTGCASFQDQTGVGDSGATDVIAHSVAPETETVSITITETDAESPHTARTLEMSPGETVDPMNAGKLPTNTSGYPVEVAVTDGPSETFEWTDPRSNSRRFGCRSARLETSCFSFRRGETPRWHVVAPSTFGRSEPTCRPNLDREPRGEDRALHAEPAR